jgi:hypothetical protein
LDLRVAGSNPACAAKKGQVDVTSFSFKKIRSPLSRVGKLTVGKLAASVEPKLPTANLPTANLTSIEIVKERVFQQQILILFCTLTNNLGQ